MHVLLENLLSDQGLLTEARNVSKSIASKYSSCQFLTLLYDKIKHTQQKGVEIALDSCK